MQVRGLCYMQLSRSPGCHRATLNDRVTSSRRKPVIRNPRQSERSLRGPLRCERCWWIPSGGKSHSVVPLLFTPPPPPIIASFSSGSVFFIITSNTPLSTSTLAKCQLPCQVKTVTRAMRGQTVRVSCCCCHCPTY